MSNFELVCSSNFNGSIPVHKYKSSVTGLNVVLGEVESPFVSGFITIATEAHDDDGLPHTLEHLVFLGSQSYPYKGVLDLIANRCLASGTNACTATDYTAYSLDTAGPDGFLTLLPIYMDHILYPTLTDSAFLTEVHHVTGKGENNGVVYCEMQGIENSGEFQSNRELLRLLYPNSGYCAETGGLMENLRTSTTNDKVRDYHVQFYRPENTYIIIMGKVEPSKIFEALEPVEESILNHEFLPPFDRPWQTPVEPLEDSTSKKIYFPSEEEKFGMVYVGWRGPEMSADSLELKAITVLLQYLSQSSISVLQTQMVQILDPYAGGISCETLEYSQTSFYIHFSNVPISKMELVFELMFDILNKMVEERWIDTEEFGMERINVLIDRTIQQIWSTFESSADFCVVSYVLRDVLYGNTNDDFKIRMNSIDQWEYLKTFDEDYWLDLITKYMIKGNYVEIQAYPSISEKNRIAAEKLEIIENYRIELGSDGLAEKDIALKEAIQLNEIEPPPEMLSNIKIPGIEDIKFHSTVVYRMNELESPPGFEMENFPVYIEAFNINTNFVYIKSIMNTSDILPTQRLYLPLMFNLFMESPIELDGELISYEEVVSGLESNTIKSHSILGTDGTACNFYCGSYSQLATMFLQVEPKKYENGVNWLLNIMYFTKFDVERIRVIATKLINDISTTKQVGYFVLGAISNSFYYKDDTNVKANMIFQQLKFLTELVEKLDEETTLQGVIDDFNEIRDILTTPKNVGIQIIANWEKLSEMDINLNEPWMKMKYDPEICKTLTVIPDWAIMDRAGGFCDTNGVVYGMAESESANLLQSVSCLADYMSPDLPALLLFLQYFCQLEGPVWRKVRGKGLAYGCTLSPNPEKGLLYLAISRSTNIFAAYNEIKTILETHLNERNPFDCNLLESARSSLIYEKVQNEKFVGNLPAQLFASSLRNVPINYNQEMIHLINDVSEDELFMVGEKYIPALFSDAAKTSIVCHPDKVQEIVDSFAEIGRILQDDGNLECYLGGD